MPAMLQKEFPFRAVFFFLVPHTGETQFSVYSRNESIGIMIALMLTDKNVTGSLGKRTLHYCATTQIRW